MIFEQSEHGEFSKICCNTWTVYLSKPRFVLNETWNFTLSDDYSDEILRALLNLTRKRLILTYLLGNNFQATVCIVLPDLSPFWKYGSQKHNPSHFPNFWSPILGFWSSVYFFQCHQGDDALKDGSFAHILNYFAWKFGLKGTIISGILNH